MRVQRQPGALQPDLRLVGARMGRCAAWWNERHGPPGSCGHLSPSTSRDPPTLIRVRVVAAVGMHCRTLMPQIMRGILMPQIMRGSPDQGTTRATGSGALAQAQMIAAARPSEPKPQAALRFSAAVLVCQRLRHGGWSLARLAFRLAGTPRSRA